MDLAIGTPALLFPAISLLMLAFTNRFLAVAAVIRSLHAAYRKDPDPRLLDEVESLHRRSKLIRSMQLFAILSILVDVVSMGFLFVGWHGFGAAAFGVALLLMIASLIVCAQEIHISTEALELHISGIRAEERENAAK